MRSILHRLAAFLIIATSANAAPADDEITALLEPIRRKHDLPALAAMVFNTEGPIAQGVTGVRKRGTDIAATTTDLWHLGSNTKAMTATLAGTFVAEGKLAWDDPVTKHFPEFARRIDPAFREVTVADLLAHRAGLIPNLEWWTYDKNNIVRARREAARELLTNPPESKVGDYVYSNSGYVVVGSILEKLGNKSWEDLMTDRVFKPLGILRGGFGGTGTPGKIDQPWPHLESGDPTKSNGPNVDNAPILGPAGTVHMPMRGWSLFLADQLKGAAGKPALLPGAIYQEIQKPHPADATYGLGWIVVRRPWAGGKALTHAGSNTMNLSVCWLAVSNQFGVLICTNQAGDDAAGKACDEVATALIQWNRKRNANP